MRIADYGTSAGIGEANADPDEIVVQGRKQSDKALYAITAGRADLAGCASITFDKAAERIILRC